MKLHTVPYLAASGHALEHRVDLWFGLVALHCSPGPTPDLSVPFNNTFTMSAYTQVRLIWMPIT